MKASWDWSAIECECGTVLIGRPASLILSWQPGGPHAGHRITGTRRSSIEEVLQDVLGPVEAAP